MGLLSDKLFGSHHHEGSGNSIGIGMIIHGASDGVALAASNWTENEALEWIIFLGIFLHKMPASFGLTASIINQPDMNKWKSLVVILVFAFSANRWICHTRIFGSSRWRFFKCC